MGARPRARTMTVPATAVTVSTAGRTPAATPSGPASGTEPRGDSSPFRLRVALFEDEGTNFLRERRPAPLAGGDDPKAALAEWDRPACRQGCSSLPVDAFDGDEAVGGIGRCVGGVLGEIGRPRLRFRAAARDQALARAGRAHSGMLSATRMFGTSSSSIALGSGPEFPPALLLVHPGR